MRIYEVTLWEKITYSVTVSAETEEEAIEIAEGDVAQGFVDGMSQGYNARIVNEVEE